MNIIPGAGIRRLRSIVFLMAVAFAGNSWAYDEGDDGDLSNSSLEPTSIAVPAEGMTITGTASVDYPIGNEFPSFDPDWFELTLPAGVDILAIEITSTFADAATEAVWAGPGEEEVQIISIEDPTPVDFFPDSWPLSEGIFQFGVFDGNFIEIGESGAYNYVITIVTTNTPVTQIEADNSDFHVSPDGAVLNSTGPELVIGDDSLNVPRFAFVKFDVSSLASVTTATLRLSVVQSWQTGDPDSSPPFGNPGIGDVIVEDIPDYGTPGLEDLSLLGSGVQQVLIPEATNPGQVVTLDVSNAVQDAIENEQDFVAFGIFQGLDNDDWQDGFLFGSADNLDASLRPVLDLVGSSDDGPVVVVPPNLIPQVGLPGAPLLDRDVDENTPLELLVTVKDPGEDPVEVWQCASQDPRWDGTEWTIRDAHITEFDCGHIPGFLEMDNIVPSYLMANVNPPDDDPNTDYPGENEAWVGFVFVDSAIDFSDVVSGQPLWENLDARIHVDDCDAPVEERDVVAWGSLPNAPYNEERFLEDEYLEVASSQCNRKRTLTRRGSVFSGPWNDEIPPERLIWNTFIRSVMANGSPESRACVPAGVRFGIFANQLMAGLALWSSPQDYDFFVERMEAADGFAKDRESDFSTCPVNILGELRSQLTRSAFLAWDRIIHADVYVKYENPNHDYPPDPVEPPPVVQ